MALVGDPCLAARQYVLQAYGDNTSGVTCDQLKEAYCVTDTDPCVTALHGAPDVEAAFCGITCGGTPGTGGSFVPFVIAALVLGAGAYVVGRSLH